MTETAPPVADARFEPLELAPRPDAASRARGWVRDVLAGWPKEAVETARLLVSELVTNALLHARTPVTVSGWVAGTGVRFEVRDARRAVPVQKRYAADSPTGRGLQLVALLANEWGIGRDARGKTVWFTLSQVPDARPTDPAPATGATLEELGGTARAGQRGLPPDTVDVQVLALPIDVYLEAEQHNDAVVRELTLIVQAADAPGGGLEVPRRLLELAKEVRETFSPAIDGLREQVEAAIRRGQETVDIHMPVPKTGWEVLVRLAESLDEVDRYCLEGDLLTLASPPRLVRFRRWYAQQVADQMRGAPPTPWEPTAVAAPATA